MNLREFIDFRKFCPICESQLTTSFHSHRKQTIRIQGNQLIAIFKVDSLPKSSTVFKAGYAFDFNVNNFAIEFWDKTDIHCYDSVSKFYMDRFLELHNNLRVFRFHRDCTYCNQYCYNSTSLKFDFRNGTYSNLNLANECITMSQPIEDGYRIYYLVNISNTDFGPDPCAKLFTYKSSFKRTNLKLDMPAESMTVELPHVNITSADAIMNRFSNLLVFA